MSTWTNVAKDIIPYWNLLWNSTDTLLWNGTDALLIDQTSRTNVYTNITKH